MKNIKYRVKYWEWITDDDGRWVRTGLMDKKNAEIIAKNLRKVYEKVEVYLND